MKKKGVSLIEVIISLTLMAILLIPTANVVITVNKRNRSSQISQESTEIGQNIMEQIQNLSGIHEESNNDLILDYLGKEERLRIVDDSENSKKYTINKTDKNGKNYDLDIEKSINGEETQYSYDIPFFDYRKKYKVNIVSMLQNDYEAKEKEKTYSKIQTYSPKIDTATDIISNECRSEYDLIIKFSDDYSIGCEEKSESGDYFCVKKNYKSTNNLVLKLEENSGDVIASLYRNKGTANKVEIEYPSIYSKKICKIEELKSKFKDNAKILLYLSNKDSKGNEKPYTRDQNLVIQSDICIDSSKAIGDYSNAIQIDKLSGDNVTGNLDVLFDNNSYIHSVNNFNSSVRTNRTGNLYVFIVTVSLDGKEMFSGKTTAIIED